jgi:hypothetical protein
MSQYFPSEDEIQGRNQINFNQHLLNGNPQPQENMMTNEFSNPINNPPSQYSYIPIANVSNPQQAQGYIPPTNNIIVINNISQPAPIIQPVIIKQTTKYISEPNTSNEHRVQESPKFTWLPILTKKQALIVFLLNIFLPGFGTLSVAFYDKTCFKWFFFGIVIFLSYIILLEVEKTVSIIVWVISLLFGILIYSNSR